MKTISRHLAVSLFLLTTAYSIQALSATTTWSGTVTLSSSYTVLKGDTLIIQAGTRVQLASGVSLTVKGYLYAVGTSSQQITFTSTGGTSPGSWGSIVFSDTGASNSIIKYANITYGTEVDITNANYVTIQSCNILNNYGHGINLSGGSNCTMQADTIVNTNVHHGIVIFGGSNDNCYDNTIYKSNHNQNGVGIYYTAASGHFARNDVEWYNWGIGANYGASPDSKGANNNRNNRVANCLNGLMVYQSSSLYFGYYSAQSYAWNSVFNNYNGSYYNVYTYSSSIVTAQANWWGSNPPNTSKFYVGPGDSLDYGQCCGIWLSTDPWSGNPLHSTSPAQKPKIPSDGSVQYLAIGSSSGNHSVTSGQIESTSQQNDGILLVEGVMLRGDNRCKEAKEFFKSYIAKHPDDQYAYAYLYSCANSETTPEIIQYFKSLPKQDSKDLFLSYLYLKQGDIKSAKDINESIIGNSPNAALAERARLNNFYIALHYESNLDEASAILKDAERHADLSIPMEISDAKIALEVYVDPKTGTMPNYHGSENGSTTEPQSIGLAQNYPNPFNPTTVLSYNLPVGGHVTMKVYDILGREVMTLVDGYQGAGIHTASFDGSNLSTGTYFCRLTAPNVNQVKKMILIK